MKSNHNFRIKYFEQEDILHLLITNEPEAGSVEITPNVTAELNNKGKLIGLEIINTKSLLPDFLLPKIAQLRIDLSAINFQINLNNFHTIYYDIYDK